MGRLIHTIQRPQGYGLAAVYRQDEYQLLAIADRCTIQHYIFDSTNPEYLCSEHPIKLRSPIVALTSAKYNGRDRLFAIADNKIYECSMNAQVWGHIEETTQRGVDSTVGHHRLHLLVYGENASVIRVTSDGRVFKYPYARKSQTVFLGSLGCIQVKLTATLEDNQTVAVLYSGYDLTSSLLYFSFEKENPRIIHQFASFVEAPSLIIPMNYGGVMVLSNSKAYLFPGLNQTCDLPDTYVDSSSTRASVSKGVVTIDIGLPPYVYSLFTAYTKIDDTRFLVTTDSGQTALIFVDLLFTPGRFGQSSMLLKSFTVLDVGKSTVANSLVHIQDNIFYAASRFSQSVLFSIQPEDPTLRILSFMPSSPPVLDLAYSYNTDSIRYAPDIFVCQGSYHNGELRKITYNKWRTTVLSSIQINEPFAEIIRLLPTNYLGYHSLDSRVYVGIMNASEVSRIYEIEDDGLLKKPGAIKLSNFSIDGTGISDAKMDEKGEFEWDRVWTNDDFCAFKVRNDDIKFARVMRFRDTIHIKGGHLVLTTQGGELSVKLNHDEALVCSLQFVYFRDEPYIIVAYSDGHVLFYSGSHHQLKHRWSLTCSIRKAGLVGALLCLNNKNSIVLVMVDTHGTIYQHLIRRGNIVDSCVWISKNGVPTGMNSDGLLVVMYDDHKVIGLVPKSDYFLELADFFYSPKVIKSVTVLLLYNYMFGVLLRDGTFFTVRLKDKTDVDDAHFADQLWTKALSIKNTPYLICIKNDIASSNGFKRSSTINLLDGRSMKILDTFADGEHLYTDICLLPEDKSLEIGAQYFVAIQDDGPWSQKFPIFKVEDFKVKAVANVMAEGVPLRNVSFTSIVFSDKLYAIGNELVSIELEKVENGYRWVHEGHDSAKTKRMLQYGMQVCPTQLGGVVYLDSFHGAFLQFPNEMPRRIGSLTEMLYTAICVVPPIGDEPEYIVAGDTYGRVYFRQNTIMLHSQINVLKYIEEDGSLLIGTLDGGIYRLTSQATLETYKIRKLYGTCTKTFNLPYEQNSDVSEDRAIYPSMYIEAALKRRDIAKDFIRLAAFNSSSDKGVNKTKASHLKMPMEKFIDEF